MTRLLFLILPILTAIAACAVPGPAKQTARQFYVLQETGASTAVAPFGYTPCFALRVNPVGSAPGLNTSRMAYSNAAHRLDYFAYHEWLAPPAKMLTPLIESRLQSATLFSSVIASSPDVRTELRLDSELLALQQDFAGGSSTLHFSIRVNLVNTATRSLVGTRTFIYREPASGANAEAGVAAANLAVGRFLADLATFLRAAVESLECPEKTG
jgi:cholesterol transport system auxiliary component